jgi:lipoprotein-anchoring transpeptidase ErfK/SrfK
MKANGIENGEWNPTVPSMVRCLRRFSCLVGYLFVVLHAAVAQEDGQPVLKAPSELIAVQDPPTVVPRVLDEATPENTSIVVSLGRQRAYLFVGREAAIDTPVSTGQRRGQTPAGQYTITEKAATHSSNRHGNFVDSAGNVVRAGVSTRIDAAPSGTVFRPDPAKYYMALEGEGLALHAGRLPGYPAADTAVRLPADIAPLIFQRVQQGTPVKIEE